MNIGQMDRQITLQQQVETQAPNGEEVLTWQDVATVWAEKKYDQGAEVYQADQKTAVQKVKFRIRWRPAVTTLFRVLDLSDEQSYHVDAITELGRRSGLVLSSYSRDDEAGSPTPATDTITILSVTAA